MRIVNKYAYMGAIALVGAVGFTACSSDDDLTAQDPVTSEVVKTQFSISIPGSTKTRMTQEIVQGNNVFRGMTNIRLVPFDLSTTPGDDDNTPLTGSETMFYNAIALGDIGKSELGTQSKAKLYKDIDIPLGTNAFLFYGEALSESGTDADNGALVPSFLTSGLPEGTAINTLSFGLKGILGNGDITTPQNKLLGILNNLANVTGSSGTKWSESSNDVRTYYNKFIEMTAGSANNILLAVQDLYNSMKSDNVSDDDGLKAKIIEEIEKSFSTTDVAIPYKLSYRETNTYPTSLGLPDGAVQVDWKGSAFEYVTNSIDYGSGSENLNVATLDKYVFPSSLYYWLNTNIKTSDASQESYYDNNNNWSTILAQYTNGNEVTVATKSIVLKNAIDYAVARLDVYAAFASGEIMDNATTPKPVTIPTEGFTLCGVLIGEQNAVGWNFATKGTDEYTIYDCKANYGITRTSIGNLANSTLALETQEKSGDNVNFALEFINNGNEAFTGADGIVPVGGKFYLVGALTSTSGNPNVFKQDCITKANVTIQSLKSAYNCIPDLRSPKLELGLSVDLNWEEGLVDNVTIQ